MSGTEGQDPGGTDPIDLQLPRGATGSCREQSTPPSTAPVTRLIDTNSLLQVTPYHGNKASFLGWKWSFLIAVRAISKPLYEGLKKFEDNMNQDFASLVLAQFPLPLSSSALRPLIPTSSCSGCPALPCSLLLLSSTGQACRFLLLSPREDGPRFLDLGADFRGIAVKVLW